MCLEDPDSGDTKTFSFLLYVRKRAYIQNVAHAFVRGGMDESGAIHKAVGVVKDWAAGRTPNGRGHVHPDVQAAASKAIAEWERLRAQAHGESAAKTAGKMGGKVAASVPESALAKVLRLAAPDDDPTDDPRTLASALDASLDQACQLLIGVDTNSLPPDVQQAIALLYAASYVADELLETMGVPDPDDSSAAMSSSLGRVLRLNSTSDDESAEPAPDDEDLEGGTLRADGSVVDTGGTTVGTVTAVQMTAGQRFMGRHHTGMRTAPVVSRLAAGNAVLRMQHHAGRSR